jgi:hypothetical protein
MHEISIGAALAAEFSANAEELLSLTRRVESEREAQPHIDSRGWSGPASWACQLALRLLARELDESLELLRCARDLIEAAAWEARTGD